MSGVSTRVQNVVQQVYINEIKLWRRGWASSFKEINFDRQRYSTNSTKKMCLMKLPIFADKCFDSFLELSEFSNSLGVLSLGVGF